MTHVKSIFILALVLTAGISKSFAGPNVSVNTVGGEVVYTQTFKLTSNVSEDDAYDMVQAWLTQNTDKFTSQNTEMPVGKSKNKAAVDDNFNNPQPLQSLDPASKRILGKGIAKYLGTGGSAINMLYMEYYVILQISEHQLIATISKIKYHHYNRNYVEQPIYTWQGGKPVDSADNYEKLLENSNSDVAKVSTFLTEGMDKLMGDLKTHLAQKSLLAER